MSSADWYEQRSAEILEIADTWALATSLEQSIGRFDTTPISLTQQARYSATYAFEQGQSEEAREWQRIASSLRYRGIEP